MCYSDDMKSKRCLQKDYKRLSEWRHRGVYSRKGKDMTTVRFAYYHNIERHYESLSESKHEEWSGFMRSFKIKQSRIKTV